ncbi:MAG TPA: HEAT repeat domain-containing protein [Chthoniobacterales bacterium]|nr:HEAT repeat domain-containing protein [Chthoniobacterales bacterium]
MTKKTERVKTKRGEVVLKLNEPVRAVPGGSRRGSVRVSGPEFAMVRLRERVNRLLLAHDLERPISSISPRDLALIRQISLEGAVTNQEPALRLNAIAALASFPTPENVNALVDLAAHGEDYYVRGHALQALGATGLQPVVSILREGLKSSSGFEKRAAEKGLLQLGRKIGPAALRVAFHGERQESALEGLKRVLDSLAAPKENTGKRAPKRSVTAKRPRQSYSAGT